MEKLFKKYGILAIFIVSGAIAGYLYWYYIGCSSGTCPITSNWVTTTLYGSFFGYVVGDMVQKPLRKNKKMEEKSHE